jgi:hypothetical protein
MVTSQPHIPRLLDRTNNRDPGRDPELSMSSIQADIATFCRSWPQAERDSATTPDAFAYYKAFQDTDGMNILSASSEDGLQCNKRCCSAPPELLDTNEHYVRTRTISCGATVRLPNRPHTIPLATIIEQGSHSTLQSHGSLLSISRRCSLVHPIDAIPSVSHCHRTSRNLDETALQRIQEHTNQHSSLDDEIDDCASPNLESKWACSVPNVPTPHNSGQCQCHGSSVHSPPTWEDNIEDRGLKELFRGVVQHVRGASHCSVPSTSTSTSRSASTETRADRMEGFQNSSPPMSNIPSQPLCSSNGEYSALVPALTEVGQLDRRQMPTNAEQRGRWVSSANQSKLYVPTIRHVPPSKPEDDAEPVAGPHFLQPLPHLTIPLREARSSSSFMQSLSKQYLLPEPWTLSSRSRDDFSPGCTLDEVPPFRHNPPSLREHDRSREPSFCSTVSTSYSGTVLGIDMDLQQELPQTMRRTSTPVRLGTLPTPKAITTSALPVLLPLAAASGIVTRNHTTPQLSFFSPSGNLIQAEENACGSPTANTTQASHSTFSPFPKVREICARPAIVPLTTPPQSFMPLPQHLKKQQTRSRHSQSHIVPTLPDTNAVSVPGDLKCCDNVAERHSFTLRSGARRSSPDHSKAPFITHDPTGPNSYSPMSCRSTSRLLFRAVVSCTPSPNRTKKARKGIKYRATDAGGLMRRRDAEHRSEIGPRAGWATRIGFCQPWNGAGDTATQRHTANVQTEGGREKVHAVCCDGRRAAAVLVSCRPCQGPLLCDKRRDGARPGWLMACFA